MRANKLKFYLRAYIFWRAYIFGSGFFWHGSGLARAHTARNGPARDRAGPTSGRPKLARPETARAEFRPRVNGPGRVGSKSPHNFLTNFKTLYKTFFSSK